MIVPITVLMAELLCRSWGYDSHVYNMTPPRNVACIARLNRDCEDIRAIALLERIDQHVIVWDVTCNDYESGTRLVRAIQRQPSGIVTLGHTVHPCWKIAYQFYTCTNEGK